MYTVGLYYIVRAYVLSLEMGRPLEWTYETIWPSINFIGNILHEKTSFRRHPTLCKLSRLLPRL